MKPKYLKLLITGLAMLILGPVTGWILTILGFFRTATHAAQIPPGTMPDIGAHMQQTTMGMLLSILPFALGLFIGALGFFLVLLSLILNFVKPKPDSVRAAAFPALPTTAAPPRYDDSQYMPKS